jgi:DNA-binding MarR family transcriptional regulator
MFTDLAVSSLTTEVFRLNGLLLGACDALVSDLDLSSARLHVLGVIAVSPVPQPVAHIAKDLGLTRQAVQRLADEMESDGLVRFEANPRHQRAKLVVFTSKGRSTHERAAKRLEPLSKKLTQGLTEKQIESIATVLGAIRQRLKDDSEMGRARHGAGLQKTPKRRSSKTL